VQFETLLYAVHCSVFFSRGVGHPVGSTRSTTWSLLPGSVRRRRCDFIIIIIIPRGLSPTTTHLLRYLFVLDLRVFTRCDARSIRNGNVFVTQRLYFRFYVFISSHKVCVCVCVLYVIIVGRWSPTTSNTPP